MSTSFLPERGGFITSLFPKRYPRWLLIRLVGYALASLFLTWIFVLTAMILARNYVVAFLAAAAIPGLVYSIRALLKVRDATEIRDVIVVFFKRRSANRNTIEATASRETSGQIVRMSPGSIAGLKMVGEALQELLAITAALVLVVWTPILIDTQISNSIANASFAAEEQRLVQDMWQRAARSEEVRPRDLILYHMRYVADIVSTVRNRPWISFLDFFSYSADGNAIRKAVYLSLVDQVYEPMKDCTALYMNALDRQIRASAPMTEGSALRTFYDGHLDRPGAKCAVLRPVMREQESRLEFTSPSKEQDELMLKSLFLTCLKVHQESTMLVLALSGFYRHGDVADKISDLQTKFDEAEFSEKQYVDNETRVKTFEDSLITLSQVRTFHGSEDYTLYETVHIRPAIVLPMIFALYLAIRRVFIWRQHGERSWLPGVVANVVSAVELRRKRPPR